MTTTKTRQIEFVASLKIPTNAPIGFEEIASRFEEALVNALCNHPAVGAYFVQAMAEMREIHVGLRFDVAAANVEEWAEEILAEAFALFKQTEGLGAAANLKREDSSLLVG